MKKTFDEMAEEFAAKFNRSKEDFERALSDLHNGQPERMKEFGVRGHKEGLRYFLDFRGQKTTIGCRLCVASWLFQIAGVSERKTDSTILDTDPT